MAENLMKITHLVSIYGEQSLAAISPALDNYFDIKHLTLLTHQSQLENARTSASLLARKGITTCVVALENDWSPASIQAELNGAIATNTGSALTALNLSGANSVIASIGTQIFRVRRLPVFCVSPETDRIIWLAAPQGVTPPVGIDVANTLLIPDVLKLHGIAVTACWQWLNNPQTQWDDLCKAIVEEAICAPSSVAQFGGLCRTASTANPITAPLPVSNPVIARLIKKTKDTGFATTHGSDQLRLKDADTITFLSGGWLEHHVLMSARQLHKQGLITDAACGIELEIVPGVKNELDAVILANNRLILIECKARKGQSNSGHGGISVETIYKIDSIREIGTLHAVGILVTLAKPTGGEAARLAIEGVATVSGRGIENLTKTLRGILEWPRGK